MKHAILALAAALALLLPALLASGTAQAAPARACHRDGPSTQVYRGEAGSLWVDMIELYGCGSDRWHVKVQCQTGSHGTVTHYSREATGGAIRKAGCDRGQLILHGWWVGDYNGRSHQVF